MLISDWSSDVCSSDLEIKAVDLRNPRKLVSPFILSDASEIGQLRADLPFLERLGDELTRPVQPAGAAIDYIPSQYLCEFIKKSGFDRSEERRVGKECVSTCRSRWSPYH